MGAFLDKPKTTKHNEQGEGNGLRYGLSSMQGWRCEMEDAHFASTGLGENLGDWSFFAVFDGHAGCKVSEHCARHLLKCITETEEFKNGDYSNGIHTGFLRLDEAMRELPELTTNSDKSGGGGTTAVCAFISPNHIYIANCGDSRAVLCRDGTPIFATQDHKPVLPKESERIHNAGGSVMIQRVNGSLAVSRALGDYDFKNVKEKGQCEQLVSPEPEIFREERQDSDQFIVLACDGIWDVMSNEDVCNFINSRLKITNNLEQIANQVIDTCLNKGSCDNMSIIIIVFPGAPTVTSEAIEEDKRVEEQLESIIRDEIATTEISEYVELLDALQEKKIEGLPPGGGLHAKYDVVSRVFKELMPDLAHQCEEVCKNNSFMSFRK